jgi:hypothetical protein
MLMPSLELSQRVRMRKRLVTRRGGIFDHTRPIMIVESRWIRVSDLVRLRESMQCSQESAGSAWWM